MSNESFRRMVEQSPCMVAVIDREGRITFANATHRKVLGHEPEALIGTPVMALVHPDDRAVATLGLNDTYSGSGLDGGVILRLKNADGDWVTVEADGSFLEIEDGEPSVVLVTRWVGGASRRGGSELQRLAQLLHAQHEASPDGVLITALTSEPISFNTRYRELWGLTEDDVRAGYPVRKEKVWSKLVDPGRFSGLAEHLYTHPRESMAVTVDLIDGRSIEVHGTPILGPDGEPFGRAWHYRDVTERTRADAELQASEERYRRMVELSPNAIGVHQDGILRYVNAAGARMFGLPAEKLVGRNVLALIHPDDLAAVTQSAMDTNFDEAEFVEVRMARPDGAELIVELASSGTIFGGRPATQTVLRDITDRRLAERALAESEERYRNLIQTAPDAIFTHDGNRVLYANRAAADLFGFGRPESVVGLDPYELLRGVERSVFAERFGRVLAGETLRFSERRFLTYAGREADLEVALGPAVLDRRPVAQVIIRDVTLRKKEEETRLELERQLLETQKFESLGVLAGGVAHQFNNLLVGIMGNTTLALMDLDAKAPLRPLLEEVEAAAHRAAGLARQMLAYSGKGRFVLRAIDLNATVREMQELLAVSAGNETRLTLDLAPALPPIQGDPGQVHQIVLNLVQNAAESLTDDAGSVTIRTRSAVFSKQDLEGLRGAATAGGEYACLTISDTGMGIDHVTLARIFDPFFSTKFTGRGLGLAAVLGIVRGHEGAIRVQTRPGHGSTFEVLLPVAPRASSPPD